MILLSTLKKALRISTQKILVEKYSTWDYQRDYFVSALKPTLAIDAGANTGQWATKFLQKFQIPVISYEPGPRCHETLFEKAQLNTLWKIRHVALGDENSLIDFHQWDIEGGSSSLKKLTSEGEKFTGWTNKMTKEVIVQSIKLDDEEAIKGASRVWLKVDVQGYETPLLKGASDTLKRAVAVEIEVPLYQIYQGSGTFAEINELMQHHEFVLVSISTERWANPGAADCDALYIKRSEYERLKNLT